MDVEPKFFFFPGSTPTFEFILPVEVDIAGGDILFVTLSQGYQTVLEFDQDSQALQAEGNSVLLTMSQRDTLLFKQGDCEAQIRYLLQDGTSDVSCPIHGRVGRTQKDEEITA